MSTRTRRESPRRASRSCLATAILLASCGLVRPIDARDGTIGPADPHPGRRATVLALAPPESAPRVGNAGAQVVATDFGARCDGVTDDTRSLSEWSRALHSGSSGILPPGTCVFREPLRFPGTQNLSISGSGPYTTVLMYAGPDAAADLLSFGEAGRETTGLMLDGFRIASRTRMTAGAGLHLTWQTRSQIWRVVLDGQDGNGNLWRGAWFDGVDQVSFNGFEARGREAGIAVNGVAGGRGPRAGLMLGGGWKITDSAVGVHVGGAFGGLYIDGGDFGGNDRNILVDNALAPEANREIMVGPTATIDLTKAGAGIEINDTAQTGSAYFGIAGAWVASAKTHGIWVRAWKNSVVVVNGGTVFNNRGDGVRVDDGSARVSISGTSMRANGGYAIALPGGEHQVSWSALELDGNGGTIGGYDGARRPLFFSFARFDAVLSNRVGVGDDAYLGLRGEMPVLNWAPDSFVLFDPDKTVVGTTVGGRLVQTQSPKAIGLFTTPQSGGGDGVVALGIAPSAPNGNPSDAVLLYTDGKDLFMRAADGRVTRFLKQ